MQLDGKKIAFIVAGKGIEEPELTKPWQAVKDAGGQPVLLSDETGEVSAVNNDLDPAGSYPVDGTIADANVADYAGVVVPGGTVNADTLRLSTDAVQFVKDAVGAAKPIAAICHGPWILVEAGVVSGKTLTSYPSVATDIRNAGGTWVDQEVKVCPCEGWLLITSRNPDDIPAFIDAALTEFAKG